MASQTINNRTINKMEGYIATDKKKNRYIVFLLCLLALVAVFSPVPDEPSFRDVAIVFSLLFLYHIYKLQSFPKECVFYFAIWGFAVISTVFSSYIAPERTLITYLFFIILTLLFASCDFRVPQLKSFVNFYIIYGFICAILIILSWLFGFEHGQNRYSIGITGLEKNPNYVNSVIILSCCFILYRLMSVKKHILIYSVLFAIHVTGTMLTGTRAAVLTIVLCIGFIVIYDAIIKRNFKSLLVILIIGLIGFYIFTIYVPTAISSRFSGEDSFEDVLRLEMWSSNYEQFTKHPIFGMGLGGTTAFTAKLGLKVDNIHNVMLQFLYEQGIVGLLLLIVILVRIIKRTKKEDRKLIYFMMVGMYVPIMFQNGLVGLTFWWPLIILEVFSRASHKEKLYGYI